MGLMDFWKKGKAGDAAANRNSESLVDEFVRLVTTIEEKNQADPRFIERAYLYSAAASDAYGSDALLLNGPTAHRAIGIALSDNEAQELGSRVSAEYFGLRLLNLWLRAQQEESDDARQIFLEICGLMFKARRTYYARMPDKTRFVIQRTPTVGLKERERFLSLKNFLLLKELGDGCTSQHLVGCILGYADVYLGRLEIVSPREEDYVPLIVDERLASARVIKGAYLRDGSVKPESMKLVEAGRIEGAKSFRDALEFIFA
jgi:hypothetical protein